MTLPKWAGYSRVLMAYIDGIKRGTTLYAANAIHDGYVRDARYRLEAYMREDPCINAIFRAIKHGLWERAASRLEASECGIDAVWGFVNGFDG